MVGTPQSELLAYQGCGTVALCCLSFSPQRWEDRSGMRFQSPFAIAMASLLALVLVTVPVHAEDEIQPSKDPAVFKDQLLQFTLLTRKNLREIQALSPESTEPVDPTLRHNASRA